MPPIRLIAVIAAFVTCGVAMPAHADRLVIQNGELVPEAAAVAPTGVQAMTLSMVTGWLSKLTSDPEAIATATGFQPGTPMHQAATTFVRDLAANVSIAQDYVRRYLQDGRPMPGSVNDFASSFMRDMGDIGARHMSQEDAQRMLDIWRKMSDRMPAELCGKAVADGNAPDAYLPYLSKDDAAAFFSARSSGVRNYISGGRPLLPPPQEAWASIHRRTMESLPPAERERARHVMETTGAAWEDRCWYAQRLIEGLPMLDPATREQAVAGLLGYLLPRL